MQLQTVSLTVAINSIKEERMSEVPVAQPAPRALKSTLNLPNGKEENTLDSAPKPLKSTLNLPQTPFPMKANLPQNEPARLAAWQQQDLYAQIRAARAGSPT
jgi:isoleucyl-tRNA synthetase